MIKPTPGTLATVSCTECGRGARAGELWHLYFADLGEVAIYCVHPTDSSSSSGGAGTSPALATRNFELAAT